MTRTLTCILAALVLSGCGSYRPADYTGEGTMYAIANATPRYDLELEPISLMRPGHAEFQLSGLPAENLLALLSIDDPTPEKLASLDKAGVRVGMTLVDRGAVGGGRTSSKQGYLSGDWSPTPESWRTIPAEFEGINFRAPRHARYTLTIDIQLDTPLASPPVINATPHVRGGGFGTH